MHVMQVKGKWVPLDTTSPDYEHGVTRHGFDSSVRLQLVEDAPDKVRVKVVPCPSLTRQADKDDCDINVITRRYGITERTAELLERFRGSTFGDVSEVPDYRTALEIVRHADAEFSQLPVDVRTYFDNDAGRFLRAVEDPEFRAGDGVKLGLFVARPSGEGELEVEPAKPAPKGKAKTQATPKEPEES